MRTTLRLVVTVRRNVSPPAVNSSPGCTDWAAASMAAVRSRSRFTYRQMAIRQQKAKNFEQALWWADRGLALYGESAARPEAVEDLRQRSATYRSKLVPTTRPS